MKCDFCGETLKENVVVLGVFGGYSVAPFYCDNHGIAYTKEKDEELKKLIAMAKEIGGINGR